MNKKQIVEYLLSKIDESNNGIDKCGIVYEICKRFDVSNKEVLTIIKELLNLRIIFKSSGGMTTCDKLLNAKQWERFEKFFKIEEINRNVRLKRYIYE